MRQAIFYLIFFLSGVVHCSGQINNTNAAIHIVPEPVLIKSGQGHFELNKSTMILYDDGGIADIANSLAASLNTPTGYHLIAKKKVQGQQFNAIELKLNKTAMPDLDNEGYLLEVLNEGVVISANKPQGLFYGIQTLMQLLPPDIAGSSANAVQWKIPAVQITDYPRFGWRGLMLDVSRHFFSKEQVKRYIDDMAKYKFNVFHWHLTDDNGWRIEIKGLPQLTAVGAWRVPRTGKMAKFLPAQPGEKATYGGFYTQEDIKEVIAYAKERFVTIVPEVDVPGHSLALIAAYAGLSCSQKQFNIDPGSGFYKKDNNVLCVANDSTWLILDKIFTQIAALFPGEYIHVGGDEVYDGFWKSCSKDLALMQKERIANTKEWQGYFERKLQKIIAKTGKKMIGWDEVLIGSQPADAAMMSFHGMAGGTKAAKSGHYVVMTPYAHTYLDMYQGDPLLEPATYGMVRLESCYAFEPVEEGVDPRFILGGEGCLWSEAVCNERQAQYMTWPRGMALSETLWSPKAKRNWPDFVVRMQTRLKYMDETRIKYSLSFNDAIISAVKDNRDSLCVKLATEVPGLDLYYSFDGSDPDNFYPRYTGTPLAIPIGAQGIRVITYRGDKPVGRQINCSLSEIEKRVVNK